MTKSNSSLPFAACKRYYFGDFERNINTENGAVTDIDFIFADGGVSYSTVRIGREKTIGVPIILMKSTSSGHGYRRMVQMLPVHIHSLPMPGSEWGMKNSFKRIVYMDSRR